MYKTYEEVPEALQPYYVKGEQITIGFHFEEGNEEPIREYAHRTEVVSFGECVTWDFVASANKDAQIKLCDYAENQDRKDHFNALTNWFALEEPEGDMPVLATSQRKQYEVAIAKETRDTGRYAPIESSGYLWDADPESYMNMTGTLDSWDSLTGDATMEDIGLVSGGKMAWTMEDNSVVYVTKEELKRVVDAIRTRAGLLHAQYTQAKA